MIARRLKDMASAPDHRLRVAGTTVRGRRCLPVASATLGHLGGMSPLDMDGRRWDVMADDPPGRMTRLETEGFV
jgi:hypothetical protein